MNIHEHQAKEILKEYGAPISNGVVILSKEEIDDKISKLNKNEYVLKAQIHAGGRGKAGGVKLIKNKNELILEAKKMMGKILVTHQTGSEGKEVKRLYVEEASNISKEFYLSCLVDRASSKSPGPQPKLRILLDVGLINFLIIFSMARCLSHLGWVS